MAVETRTASAKVAIPPELAQAMMAAKTGQPTQPAGPQAPAEVPVSLLMPPPVAALMVISDINKLRFARAAVNNFVMQTYTNKHLVIVNGCDPAAFPVEEKLEGGTVVTLTDAERFDRTRVTNREHPWITEVRCPPGATFGKMRNIALDNVPAGIDWAIVWEDDSFGNQHRIAFQMAHRIDNDTPVMLRREVRVDVVNAVACEFSQASGIHSTLLFPTKISHKFPDTTGYEVAEFWIKNWGGRQLVVPNMGEFPQGVMQVSFWHGKNALTRQQFLGEFADPKWFKKAVITADTVAYLNTTIGPVYGANFAASKAQPQELPAKQQA